MASFYNPYMKTPDYSQGANGIMQQIMQILMMKQMMGGQQGQPTSGGQNFIGPQQPTTQTGLPQMPSQQGMGGTGGTGGMGVGLQNMNPQMIMAIIQQLLQRNGAGGSGGGGDYGASGGGLF